MLNKIDELLNEVNQFHSVVKDEIEQFRIKYNGKSTMLLLVWLNWIKFIRVEHYSLQNDATK